MNAQPVFIGFLLDRSGSMLSRRDDALGSINAFIEDQQREEGSATFLLNTFSDVCETTIRPVPIREAQPLTVRTYVPQGSTALLDAIALTIAQIDAWVAEHGPHLVYLVILTDGQENASREYRNGRAKVGTILEARQAGGWHIRFLSASWEAIQEAADLNVHHSVHIHGADGLNDTVHGTSQELSGMRRRRRHDPDSSGGGRLLN